MTSLTPTSGRLGRRLIRMIIAVLSIVTTVTIGLVGTRTVQTSAVNLANTQAQIRRGIASKGVTLVENHAIALAGMVDANAFGDVRQLIQTAVLDDPDVLYGLFMDDGGTPWAFAAPGVDSDRPSPDALQQLGLTPEDIALPRREVDLFGERALEFAAPVTIDGDPLGHIRYGLSTARLVSETAKASEESTAALTALLVELLAVISGISLLGILVASRLARSITEPVAQLAGAARQIADGARGVRAEVSSGDELQALADIFNAMVTELEDLQEGLEQKVEDRTAALAAKTDDVVNILENIEEGVFTLLPDLTLHHEYSASLSLILERNDLGGRAIEAVLLDDSSLSAADRDAAMTCLSIAVGSPGFLFECNKHVLPTEFTRNGAEGRHRGLEVTWIPLMDDADDVRSIMVSVRDITEVKALREQANQQSKELTMVGELLALSASDFQDFLAASMRRNERNLQLAATGGAGDIGEMFRNAHTIKGNASTLGLSALRDAVHAAEDLYRSVRDDGADWNAEAMTQNEEGIRSQIAAYEKVYDGWLGARDAKTNDSRNGVDVTSLEALLAAAQNGSIDRSRLVQDLSDTLQRAKSTAISAVLAGPIADAKRIASNAGKAEPRFVIEGDTPILDDQVSMWRDVLTHALRNAADHGLETPQVRLESGKSEYGTIWVTSRIDRGNLVVEIRDDGAGLDLAGLRERSVARGAPAAESPSELAQVVFESGVSTARSVTNVSGRGVGMDAVRSFLRERGGDATIRLDESGGSDRVPFSLTLWCPTEPEAQLVAPHA